MIFLESKKKGLEKTAVKNRLIRMHDCMLNMLDTLFAMRQACK